ncbi:unnamed protein product, partial [Laminaria digitata]
MKMELVGHKATGTYDQGHGEDPPAVLSGRAAHELSDHRGRPPATVRGSTRRQSRRLEGDKPAEYLLRLPHICPTLWHAIDRSVPSPFLYRRCPHLPLLHLCHALPQHPPQSPA